jgi:lysophospholipase L1-like esterase
MRPAPPLIALLLAVCAPQVFGQTAVREPVRWNSDIERFEASDRVNPPKPGSIVFVGSSSITRWETLKKDFPLLPVLNRGTGGSTLKENVQSIDRLVLPYKPPIVVLYAGENDLAEGRTPADVLHDFEAFISIVHRELPSTRVIFVSIKPSIARRNLIEKIRETNRLIRNHIGKDKRLSYVDVFTPMVDSLGQPRAELFVEDSLHMNAKGYAIWINLIKPHIHRRHARSGSALNR